MKRSPSCSSSFIISPSPIERSKRAATKAAQSTKGVADYLRSHDKMASLLPAAQRMAALQQDCVAILPAIFDSCAVLKFDSGQLTLTVPNAALSSRLKQQVPKLQENLLQRGWQVNAIRLKLQQRNSIEKPHKIKQLVLPSQAVSSFSCLNDSLEDTPQNAALKDAITSVLKQHRNPR